MKQQLMCSLMIVFFVVTGCASMSNRAKCAATGAAVGAAIGATTGGIIGHNNSGAHVRTEGAIVGGAIGALVGGTAGFLICKDDAIIAEPVPQPAPPRPVAQPVPRPAPQPVAQKIVLNSIQFDFDQATIKPEFYPILDAAAQSLKQQPGTMVAIQGHTDSIGTEEYNRELSVRRAEAVKAYLIGQGIARENLSVQGFGEEKPVGNNQTAEGRRMNRRVEFIIKN